MIFHFTGSSHFQQHPFNFSIDSQLTWQPEPHQIQLKKLTLTADSPSNKPIYKPMPAMQNGDMGNGTLPNSMPFSLPLTNKPIGMAC